MRKKLTFGIGLVVVSLTVVLVVVAVIPTPEPPFRVGMSPKEVGDVMDSPGIRERQRGDFLTMVDGTPPNTPLQKPPIGWEIGRPLKFVTTGIIG